jgi:glycosidase
MPTSVWSPEIDVVIAAARAPGTKRIRVSDRVVEVPTPFPSPRDWRDHPIYQILVDRFDNPAAAPRHSWDGAHGEFQGGTFEGIRQRLDYLRDLGVGALWLSPVLKNRSSDHFSHHGYGIQDFLVVEPRFATAPERAADELRTLVDEAHARGLYVIFDVVLNHAGDVFAYTCDGDPRCQDTGGAEASWRASPYAIRWRDAAGQGRDDWPEPPADSPADGVVWPTELQCNAAFRRQGLGGEGGGDFAALKELVTDLRQEDPERGNVYPVRDVLIRACQHLIAAFDVDGFRIDTLKYVERDFAQIFGGAIREFALSLGKKNFFTFGEVYDEEEQIARFVGRDALEPGDLVGVDAALDFPLFFRLPAVAKGFRAPADVAAMFARRKEVQQGIVSSHGEASRFFVTFLDNHDQRERLYHSPPDAPHRFDDQITLAIGCLFALQGIPCLYYGTEQGLASTVERYAPGVDIGSLPLEAVREALWGKPDAFDLEHPFSQSIRRLAEVRAGQPALRYGRQYFRPVSGDGVHFGLSPFPGGVLAWSRILQDQEVVVVANTNALDEWQGEVIVDRAINARASAYRILFSNQGEDAATAPGPLAAKTANQVEIIEVNGVVTRGPARALPVALRAMEVQVLGRAG